MLLGLSQEVGPCPVLVENQSLISLILIPMLLVLVYEVTEILEPSLDVTVAWTHLVCGKAYHGVHAQAVGNIIILGQFTCFQLTCHDSGDGGRA